MVAASLRLLNRAQSVLKHDDRGRWTRVPQLPTTIRFFRFHRWIANPCALEIEELKSVPYAAVYHPFVERVTGKIHTLPRNASKD